MQTLQKRLTTPNQKITATWPAIDKRVIYAACGLKWPKHPIDKDGAAKPPFKQIRDYTGKDLSELEKKLISFQRLIGITTLCADTEMESVLGYLQDAFADFNQLEFELAYLAATEGLLGLTDRDQQHYDAFTPGYLKKLLSAYRYYRQKLLNKHATIELEMALEADKALEPELTPTEQIEFDKNFCITAFNTFVETKVVFGLNRVYDILYKYELLSFTDERKAEFKTTAIERLNRLARTDTRTKTTMQAFAQGMDIGTKTVIQESKKVAIEVLFNDMYATESSPEILFENIKVTL